MIIEARNIHKSYGSSGVRLQVLRDVSLTVAAGEFVAVQGASGAGKSTLLHVLGGLDPPSSGEVLIEGKNLYTMKEQHRAAVRNRKIGFVFQFFHLLADCTALENVMLPARIAGMQLAAVRTRAERLLFHVGLKDRLRHHPAQLSGGEQQRVALCRALINEPTILCCDEPTGNLDSRTGAAIGELLQRLNREQGYTVVVATHAASVAALASRIIFIHDGKLQKAAAIVDL